LQLVDAMVRFVASLLLLPIVSALKTFPHCPRIATKRLTPLAAAAGTSLVTDRRRAAAADADAAEERLCQEALVRARVAKRCVVPAYAASAALALVAPAASLPQQALAVGSALSVVPAIAAAYDCVGEGDATVPLRVAVAAACLLSAAWLEAAPLLSGGAAAYAPWARAAGVGAFAYGALAVLPLRRPAPGGWELRPRVDAQWAALAVGLAACGAVAVLAPLPLAAAPAGVTAAFARAHGVWVLAAAFAAAQVARGPTRRLRNGLYAAAAAQLVFALARLAFERGPLQVAALAVYALLCIKA
jgi:hypothetical protein